jgi:hypothetical protein
MQVSVLGVGLLAASLGCSWAQVTVEVTQEQQHFLQGETLPVNVRITNRSGQSLQLGSGDDWLTFAVEAREGVVVPRVGDVPVAGEFTLESSKAAIKTVDLAPWFVLNQSGHYSVVATVRIKQWNQEITSRPAYFDITDAPKLWEQPVGLAGGAGDTNRTPEIHKYVLQQATYIRGQLRLYLRVTDAYDKTLRVVPVGPMLTFGRPDPRVDRSNNLHLLYQSGPHSLSYSLFNPDGELLIRQTYDYAGTRPRFTTDIEGNVSVVGGVRHISANDVPAPLQDDAGSSAPTPAASPPQTNSASRP